VSIETPSYSTSVAPQAVPSVASHINYLVDRLGPSAFDGGAIGWDDQTRLYDDLDSPVATMLGDLIGYPASSHAFRDLYALSANNVWVVWFTNQTNLYDDSNSTYATSSTTSDPAVYGDRRSPLVIGSPVSLAIPSGHGLKQGDYIYIRYGSSSSTTLTAHIHAVTASQGAGAGISIPSFATAIPNSSAGRYFTILINRNNSPTSGYIIHEMRIVTLGGPTTNAVRYDRGSPSLLHTPSRLVIPSGHNLPAALSLTLGYGETSVYSARVVHATRVLSSADAAGAITWDFASFPDAPGASGASISRYIFFEFGAVTSLIPQVGELRFTDTPAGSLQFATTTRGPVIRRDMQAPNNVIGSVLGGRGFGISNGPARRLVVYDYHKLRGADLATLDGAWSTSRQGADPIMVRLHDGEELPMRVVGFERDQDSKILLADLGPSYHITITLLEEPES